MGKGRARRPQRKNPLTGLRGISKTIRATEAEWRNQFATRHDVADIVERYLDRYDEMVVERWYWRFKLPVRVVGKAIMRVVAWVKHLFARMMGTLEIKEEVNDVAQ